MFVADCTVSNEDYVQRVKELGHKVISSVEHGFQGCFPKVYELVEENNANVKKRFEAGEISEEQYQNELLKFVFGAEAYWVKDRKKEYPVKDKKTGEYKKDKSGNLIYRKDRSNCHIILLAKNEEGRQEITEILSTANEDGYYGQPRVDLELLLSLNPKNVFVTSACIAFWKYDDVEDVVKLLHDHFGDSFMLEIQSHATQEQIDLNRRIIELSEKYGIDIIFGYDSHYIYPEQAEERDNYISTRRNNYNKDDDSEAGWYMDYPDEETIRQRLRDQHVLTEEQIDRCIKNTDITLTFDDLHFDKEVKLPSSDLSMNQEQKDKALTDLVWSKWEKVKPTVDQSKIPEYEEGINYELNAIINTHMADYFLIDYKIVQRGIEKGGIITKTGRGSGVSYYVNSLLGFSDIDRFAAPVKLYPDRFMSETRILQTRSLPDLDINSGNPQVFAEAQDEVMTEIYGGSGHAFPMISYKPLQKSSAFKLYAKAKGLDFDTANEVTEQIARYEKAVKHADTPEEKDALDIYDFVDKEFHPYLKESQKYEGIINAKSQAPCSYLIYEGDIRREIGLIRCVAGGENGDEQKGVLTTVIDGATAESFKFVKNDLLKVDVWLTINQIFDRIGIPTYTVAQMTKAVENDKPTWSIYEKGCTLGVNQCESDFGRQCCTRYKPQNMQELTALVAALRPGFKSQLQDFLDRKPHTTGIKELDALLSDSFQMIMYQENLMTLLGWLGIEQTETYGIIKKISKKKFKDKELAELKGRLLKGWIGHTGTEDGFDQTWQVMEDFAKYAFNASHAYSYAYDSVYGAYLKAHYPYEFYSIMMQHLSEKGEKDKVSAYKQEMQKFFGIKNGEYKFGLDNRQFVIDKERHCINPSLVSIKAFSQSTADLLYELGQKHYDSFVDVLEALRNAGIAEARIIDLININYFQNYGGINYLLKALEYFGMFYKNKKYLSQCKKETIFSLKIDYDLIRRHCGSETPKMFMKLDSKGIVKELIEQTEDKKEPFEEVIRRRFDVLGYIDIIDKKYKGICMATDINVDYSPKVQLYALANGNTIPVKIEKRVFKDKPIKRGDIVRVINSYRKPKQKKVNGKWQESEEQEWWINEYKVC